MLYMANSFNELIKTGAEQIAKLRWLMSAEERKATHARVDSFVAKALRRAGKHQDVKRLEECGRGSYCGNIYCGGCRDRMAAKLLARVRAHLVSHDMGEDSCRERLRWVTVLHSLEKAEIGAVREATTRARADYTQLNRKFAGSWAQGAFEYELVDMEKVSLRVANNDSGVRKRDTLERLGGFDGSWRWVDEAGNERTDYVLVHTHFLMDCGEEDWNAIDADMRKRWNGDYQVRIDGLTDFNVRSLDESLWKMSSYCFKNRCSHHYEFGGYTFEEEDMDVNESMFSVNELNTIYAIYKDMAGGRNTGLLLGWGMKN
jgi:hypothetical protein